MSNIGNNTVHVQVGSYIQDEKLASVAIMPAMLVELDGSGGVKPHAVADVAAVPRFARENQIVGGTIDDQYAIGDTTVYDTFPTGSKVQCIIADGQTITEGDWMCSAGDGTLKKVAAAEIKIAQAEETLTASGSSEFLTITIL